MLIYVPDDGCTCEECVNMCKTYSCTPMPQEAKALIDAGFSDRLMLDVRPSISHPHIVVPVLLRFYTIR